jgi:hypothetical protein
MSDSSVVIAELGRALQDEKRRMAVIIDSHAVLITRLKEIEMAANKVIEESKRLALSYTGAAITNLRETLEKSIR